MPPFTLPPRHLSAAEPEFRPPGSWDFWVAAAHEADLFAYTTVLEGKGGPFGASLWIHDARTDRYILIGHQDSNAVVSKGIASAHAEAENLSPENRAEVIRVLRSEQSKHNGSNEGFAVVQVSSGESCPSCRAKQTVFAEELYALGLLKRKQFFVVFKACYERTYSDAGFNDAPYDMLFRLIAHRDLRSLFALDDVLRTEPEAAESVELGAMCSASVVKESLDNVPKIVADVIDARNWTTGATPFAVIINSRGTKVLTAVASERTGAEPANAFEKTAIQHAIASAAREIRAEGCFESWDLGEAQLFTNIGDIGPIALGDSLWANIAKIVVISELCTDSSVEAGREEPHLSNFDLLRRVCAEYNAPEASVTVSFSGSEDAPSVAHLLWRAKIMHEDLQRTNNASEMFDHRFVKPDGSPASLLPAASQAKKLQKSSSHYNGKQTVSTSTNSPPSLTHSLGGNSF